MSRISVVGLVGSFSRPSRTRSLVSRVVGSVSEEYGAVAQIVDLDDFGASLGGARRLDDLDGQALALVERIVASDALVVGSPTYKGSYTGMFKHLLDLLEPASLQGKPIILTATGGTERHALIIEHQLRPLFGFFCAHTLPTGIFATHADFEDHARLSAPVEERIARATTELGFFLAPQAASAAAAE